MTPREPLGDALELMRLLWSVDQGLQQTSKRMQAAIGITAPQRLVLRLIGRFPGLAMGQLAELMLVHPSTVTGIVQRLGKRDFIERHADPNDARRAFLHLTPKGARWSAEKGGTVEAAVRGVLATAAPQTVRRARELLTSLAGALQRASRTLGRPKPAARTRRGRRHER